MERLKLREPDSEKSAAYHVLTLLFMDLNGLPTFQAMLAKDVQGWLAFRDAHGRVGHLNPQEHLKPE
jgi:hypothetical protein